MKLPIAIITAGFIASGCNPPTQYDRFNSASYTANTDSTGFTGTWIVTMNNESEGLPAGEARYSREILRLRPAADGVSYEFYSCFTPDVDRLVRATATTAGNTITVPHYRYGSSTVEQTTYSMNAEGTMEAVVATGATTTIYRAVRLSGNPDLNIGTITADKTDELAANTKPAICLQELVTKTASGNDQLLLASGNEGNYDANGSAAAYPALFFARVPGFTTLAGYDYPGFSGYGGGFEGIPLTSAISSSTRTIQGNATVSGSLGGSIAFNIALW